MDITNFIQWFISETIKIFSWFFNLLDSITFMGTSLLKVIITIIIISALLGVVLTIGQSVSVVGHKSEKIKEKRSEATAKDKSRWI